MSGYLKSRLFETNFDGDNVRVRLKPLLFNDLVKFKSATQNDEAIVLFQQIIPQYVEDLAGLTDKAGSPISIGEVCSSVYFIDLVKQIGLDLIKGSSVERPQTPVEPSALQ